MTYDPNRTTVLPQVASPFPITEELPAVVGARRGPSGRWFLMVVGGLLIAGIIAIAALLIIDNRRSDQASSDDATTAPTLAPVVDAGQTPAPTAVELDASEPGFWQVIGVPDGLNVRSGPGIDNPIVGSLNAGDRHIFATGERSTVNGAEWKQITFGDSDSVGWVSARFLATDIAPGDATPTATPTATGSTSVVCFRSDGTPAVIARIEFTNSTQITGLVRTITSQSTTDQTVAGTLDNGRADITLTDLASSRTTRQPWVFNPASVELGDGPTLSVVNCALIASQLL